MKQSEEEKALTKEEIALKRALLEKQTEEKKQEIKEILLMAQVAKKFIETKNTEEDLTEEDLIAKQTAKIIIEKMLNTKPQEEENIMKTSGDANETDTQ